jgi:glutamate dehydrogenase/leucine dehydrogenase
MPEIVDLTTGSDTHELVRLVRDPGVGLTAIIAIDSTALGPAMGGVRRRPYPTLESAVADARRLSTAMTLKNAAAGLPLGGGKAVIVDAGGEPSDAMLDAFAGALEQLGGRYIAAEDIGTTPHHMDRLARTTRWVTGRSTERGGSGDPSPATARTVFGAMRAAARQRWGEADLRGRTVGILGVGKVGAALAALVAGAGADLVLADIDPARAETVAAVHPRATVAGVDALPTAPLDLLAPCATGGLLGPGISGELRCEIVCGAANNMLIDDAIADELAERDILYVPDFLANAGGIILVAASHLGWPPARLERQLEAAISRTAQALEGAARGGFPPLVAAHAIVTERLASAAVSGGAPGR